MKALVNTYLNIRTGSPGIEENNNPGYYYPGDEIEIINTVVGMPYKGNSIWYRLPANGYVWSGGIDGAAFIVGEADFMMLTQAQQYSVLLQAREYYAPDMLSDAYGVTGIYIGKKIVNNIELPELSLSFQVMAKGDAVSWKQIPATLPFKGYAIPTDIVQEDFMELQLTFPGDAMQGKPGGSVSRQGRPDWGSCSFIAEKQQDGFTNYYLVTNYHVAAFDRLLQQKYSYDIGHHQGDFLQMVMPSWRATANEKNKIGFLYQGLFDEWHDTALIRVPDKSAITNQLAPGLKIQGVLDVLDEDQFLGRQVTMYGAFSGKVSGKKIISVNSSQRTLINGKIFVKSELIQAERMSNSGDSGSPVLIGDELVGIIIGADTNNTYILSAAKIINFFNLIISTK